MDLAEKLMQDQQEALRTGDQVKLSSLRLLRSAIHYQEVERGGKLDDEAIISVISKQVKQRRESIEEFKKGNRPDLVAKEESEIAVLQEYLPPQVSQEEVEAVVREVIADTGAQGRKDMGKVMPQVMSRLRGKADGRLVSQVVQDLLAQS